eukprot:TRINITY_DN104753_c0_g1_i1.p1 TRINITY_DN104753_c0_g1~~TRINITY_DN104753_c0_g1_i1.p1  ORF type:complete len:660 (-),score=96.38 TRINITY_DN104753_c0_g1_i1:73-2052(-)
MEFPPGDQEPMDLDAFSPMAPRVLSPSAASVARSPTSGEVLATAGREAARDMQNMGARLGPDRAGTLACGSSLPSNMGRATVGPGFPSTVRLPSAAELHAELSAAVLQLSFCELTSSAQWAAELCASLPSDAASRAPGALQLGPVAVPGGSAGAKACSVLMLAKTHFGMREYGRAAHVLQQVRELQQQPAAVFLKAYSLYLAGEKRREEEAMEVADPVEKCQVRNAELKDLQRELSVLYETRLLDGLGLYLYGITLKGLEMKHEARKILLEAVHDFPCNWSAWLDIISISSDLNDVSDAFRDLNLPDHWMVLFFQAALNVELQRNENAKEGYDMLRKLFPDSPYIISQLATCYYNMRNFDSSQAAFDEVRRRDPYRLTGLDTYSNILFVKEQAPELSNLARHAVKIDKYTPEACCIIGNYYSLKGEHEKAVTYFQRALSLNRNFTPAWILMGHEFMEMKNTPAAIDAYRTAVTINQRDYRAWYGLGQTYELLSLHFYALFYYRQAMTLRPDDARMWCAMAQCYDNMDHKQEALKCYEKAHRCGDREKMALPRLARLHRDLGDRKQAAAYYNQMLAQSGHCINISAGGTGPISGGPLQPRVLGSSGLSTDIIEALRFIMFFAAEEGRVAESEACATKLLDTSGPEKDEAKAMLRNLRQSS